MADSQKRKRSGDPKQSEKHKASLAQGGPKEVRVTSILKPQVSPPVIATAPGLELSQNLTFHSYAKAEQPAQKRRKSDNPPPPPELLLHSTTNENVHYTARENRKNGVEPYLKHYLGIFDSKTGELQVIEARKMEVRAVVQSQMATKGQMTGRGFIPTMMEMRTELGEAFGTKKAKKALKSVQENAISSAKGSSKKLGSAEIAVMDSIMDATQNMATKEELQAAADQSRPVPRGNLDAEEIQDVYVPAEIIGSEVLNAIPIMDWQEKGRTSEPVNAPSRFVAHRVMRVAQLESGGVLRLKVLRYLLWLIVLYNTAERGKERGTKRIAQRDHLRQSMAPAPDVVIENIRRKFSDGGTMRKQHIDLLMTHCCVFSSIIDNFQSNTFDLREDLKMEQKQLSQYFNEIGARMKQHKVGTKTDHIAVLALPLQFPKIQQGRRSKK
ncbi:RNA polymerase I associated factor, A49-like protein [Apodospora peruviana]|uniref:RNA polymerase I associated factor, A49-like protein n=1 Tax=Apodospora peruviana TaxID=516989 RepID=A0AAE0IDY4_9PEZI|nr:RNA polymerase I associated factor, A49-like protein [Apodospora peruviana]